MNMTQYRCVFAVAKYILPLGKPFLNNNYVIADMMVIQLDAHESVITKIYLYTAWGPVKSGQLKVIRV